MDDAMELGPGGWADQTQLRELTLESDRGLRHR
jgi:hypothetical protein